MKVERPKQNVPKEIVDDLMGVIRNQFYGDRQDSFWADQEFIRRRVVTWPARWLHGRGVTLKPERYKAILLGIFQEIKQHGDTGAVKYWPGYLVHCVQEHFQHHGEEIYGEAKALRNLVENALLAGQRAADEAQGNDPVAAIAMAHGVLMAAHKRKRKVVGERQINLL